MRLLASALALALLIAVASAAAANSIWNATGYPAGAKLFGYQVVPQGIGFSVENFTCDEGGSKFPYEEKKAYAIVSYGEPAAFFTLDGAHGSAFNGIRPATDEAGIAGYLYCYYAAAGHAPNLTGGFSAIHAEIAKLKNSQRRGEAGCRILLDTDRLPCTSFETCQQACYSVTSFCQPFALGAGRAFVNEIWAFENNSRALDAAYSAEGKAYAAFAGNASNELAQGYLGAVNETYAAAERAAASQLFYDYSFCFSPDYPADSLYALKMRAERQYRNSSVFYGIPARSADIANRTAAAIEEKEKYRPPVIEESAKDCAPGALCGNATLNYSEAAAQAEPPSFIAGILDGIASFFRGWLQRGK
ncbi:MAG: hypothetical protein NTX79_02185 [Candidatus Micrarchaeota archaeon]|nr:hypothetical protein [Candidatus Micrarchaeota archaeon]